MLLPIHIAAGGAAVILGYTALFAKKGGTVHRRSGMLFVYAMLVMGVSASILEFMKSTNATKVVAALMSIYLCGRRSPPFDVHRDRPASSTSRR